MIRGDFDSFHDRYILVVDVIFRIAGFFFFISSFTPMSMGP